MSDNANNATDVIYQGLVLPADGCCFHCGEPLPKVPFFTAVLGADRAMCCLGCQLASQSIVEAGLSQYYLDRREISPTASLPDAIDYNVYNHDDIKNQFTYREDGASVAELSIANLRCAACTWLIEKRLRQIDGVGFCQVNLTQQRMRVAWQDDKVAIGEILSAVNQIGYEAKPYRQDTHEAMMKRENKRMLIRLAIAGFGAMQAMMFSVGLYFGHYTGIAPEHKDFLRWVSMVVSLPVVAYAGLPFFRSAWSALKARQINMDVPVCIALLLTFFASMYATLTHQGETYFDSVAMFIFFLLAGRYVEQTARLKAANMASDLVVVIPKLVNRLTQNSELSQQMSNDTNENAKRIDEWLDGKDIFYQDSDVIHKVVVGDVVRVDAGGEIIGDGVLISDMASVSQSLLTGESELVVKQKGDILLGGSQNDATPLVMVVTKNADDSQIALIDRLINRAMSEKPKIAQDADRMARWFVARVLILALLVFIAWWFFDPSRALWATVAVLVATCPCALGLATPIALTVATNRLAGLGFLTTRGHTIQTLSMIDGVAFDKTGTLTTGKAQLVAMRYQDKTGKMIEYLPNGTNYEQNEFFALAAALEVGSRHPVALSLLNQAKNLHLPKITELNHHSAGGVSGYYQDKKYRIGHIGFALGSDVAQDFIKNFEQDLENYEANMAVVLSRAIDDTAQKFEAIAIFYFNDRLRTDSVKLINRLKEMNLMPIMLTGDPSHHVARVADRLGIDYRQGLLPEDKVNFIKGLQADGKKVLMVGDGINDAPVLAAADVSVAMANASDLAQVSADSVLLSETLMPIVKAVEIAKKTQTIIRQNLRWAVVYNTLVIVPAALGYVPPWLAAIGMSLSSLGVVLNALRIKRA